MAFGNGTLTGQVIVQWTIARSVAQSRKATGKGFSAKTSVGKSGRA